MDRSVNILQKLIFIFLFTFLFFSQNVTGQISAQDSIRLKGISTMKMDTVKVAKILNLDSTAKKPFKIIPRLATKRSAMVPGWGQIYIKQGWFVPVIYGGFATTGYFIARWQKNYKVFRTAYFAISAENDKITAEAKKAGTIPKLLDKYPVKYKGEITEFSIANLKSGTNFYRRNRDFTMLLVPVVWAINILEVNVAAHLKSFDMTDDISMKIEPSFQPNPFNGLPTAGGRVVFAFR
jgi:Family of unknown function (DUF5683)